MNNYFLQSYFLQVWRDAKPAEIVRFPSAVNCWQYVINNDIEYYVLWCAQSILDHSGPAIFDKPPIISKP